MPRVGHRKPKSTVYPQLDCFWRRGRNMFTRLEFTRAFYTSRLWIIFFRVQYCKFLVFECLCLQQCNYLVFSRESLACTLESRQGRAQTYTYLTNAGFILMKGPQWIHNSCVLLLGGYAARRLICLNSHRWNGRASVIITILRPGRVVDNHHVYRFLLPDGHFYCK